LRNSTLHIVALNIPYPDNYGGVIDIFCKIKSLHQIGIDIHLHCFEYGRSESKELNKYCKSVYYYKRNTKWINLFSNIPFIVKTRKNKKLTERLSKDSHPILFEGLHTSYCANHSDLKKKNIYLRAHNIEQNYYRALFKKEKNFLRKIFFFSEFIKLKFYEKKISSFDTIFTISKKDDIYFASMYKTTLINAFHQHQEIEIKSGLGDYALYHGNLEVIENKNAALFFIEIFKNNNYQLVIAGKNPSSKLKKIILKNSRVKLVENPSNTQLDNLIKNAQLNILTTEQQTGLKLKLLKVLFLGRHCIVNSKMLFGTELKQFCTLANTPEQWQQKIKELKNKKFSEEDLKNRNEIRSIYNNTKEAQKIKKIIF
jgi:hypothetical protein